MKGYWVSLFLAKGKSTMKEIAFLERKMLSGSIVALVTPMDDKGQLDYESLKQLVDFHVKAGTDALVSVGTTGESATMSINEHIEVVLETLKLAAGRIPVIAGTGSNATKEAIAITKKFEGSGIAACLTVVPYYNKPTQEGLYQHFKAIAQSTDLPQILYNVPGRTVTDLLPETVARLAKIDNIVGLKDATGDVSRVAKHRELCGDNFILLSGDDLTSLDFIFAGGNGVISVTNNVTPYEMKQMIQYANAGEKAKARALDEQMRPLHKDLFIEANPIPVKWALKEMGLIASTHLRLPLTPLSLRCQPKVKQALQDAGVL